LLVPKIQDGHSDQRGYEDSHPHLPLRQLAG
jgi:hypothetical protein